MTTRYEARLRAAAASLSRTLEAEATRVGRVADTLNFGVAENIIISLGAAVREARLLAVLVQRRKAELAGANQPPETELERAERHERFDLAMAGAIQPLHDEDGPDTRQSIDTRSLPRDGNRQTYAPPDDDVKDCPDGEGDLVGLMERRGER